MNPDKQQQLEDLYNKLLAEFGVNLVSDTGAMSQVFYSVRHTSLLNVVRFFEQPNYIYSHETHDFSDSYYYVNIIANFKVIVTYWHSEELNPNGSSVCIYIW